MEPPAEVTEFQSSQLGTKEHWDDAYERELANFKEHGDPGEVWYAISHVKKEMRRWNIVSRLGRFGESCLEILLDWLDECAEEIDELKEASVLDIGCGNGYTLLELAKRGWTSLHGSDYSAPAVDLAKRLAEKEELDVEIDYFVDDILNSRVTTKYRVLLDKGTFDAIALNPDRSFRTKYVTAVRALAGPDSILVITSCNFTRAELRQIFTEKGEWKSWKFIEYPTFSFGGHEGSAVSTVAFKPL